MPHRDLEELWRSGSDQRAPFDPAALADLPDPARRYLAHAIAEGAPLASAVRLKMHGEIRLGRADGQQWSPFEADQVIRWDRGMIWRARVKMKGLPVRGFDRLIDGAAAMRWRLFGVIPVMRADGPDITRSAAGRVSAEAVWLPSVLLGSARWTAEDPSHAHASLVVAGEHADLRLTVAEDGSLRECTLSRWGNPEGEDFHYAPFGGLVLRERTFGAYTIPSELRIGWYPDAPLFADEGEFIRVTVDEAEHR